MARKKFKLDLNELRRLYCVEKKSRSELCEFFKCGHWIITDRLKSMNIKLNSYKPLMSLEAKKNMSLAKIGKKLSPEHRLKNIETLRLHKEKVKGMTRIDAYGKDKAEKWAKNTSLAISGENNHSFGKHHSQEHRQNISNSMKGKIPKNLKQINSNKKGSGNPMYGKMGKLSPQYIHGNAYEPYPSCWNKNLKNKIRKRDNQVCMNCGIHREKLNKAFDVHHINYDKSNCFPQNLISLCHKCHMITRINREYWKRLFQEKLCKLYNYQYIKGEILINVI